MHKLSTDDHIFHAALAMGQQLFKDLDRHWTDGAGMNRTGYSEAETKAHEMVMKTALSLGMEVYQDPALNTYLVLKGSDRTLPAFASGSHMDSVMNGGRYDGPAGVVAPLCAAFAMAKKNIVPPQDFVIPMWRCEESPTFNQFAVGSRFAFGLATSTDVLTLRRSRNSERFQDILNSLGGDRAEERLRSAMDEYGSLIPQGAVGALIETHIEQYNSLAKAGLNIGVVLATRGNLRATINYTGEAAHTGSTPMHDRKDCSMADASLKKTMLRWFNSVRKNFDPNATITFPFSHIGQSDQKTSVAETGTTAFEIRSTNNLFLQAAKTRLLKAVQGISKKTGVTINLPQDKMILTPPSAFDSPLITSIQDAANLNQIHAPRMESGAGHDAAVAATAGVRASMLFLAHSNLSHNPAEDMAPNGQNPFEKSAPFADAIRILFSLACQPTGAPKSKHSGFFAKLEERRFRESRYWHQLTLA